MTRWMFTIVVAVLLTTGTAPAASAQGLTGQISGTVVDSGGDVMPGVTVTIKNAATATTRGTVTGSDGAFLFPDLLAGTYDLKAEITGFKTYEQKGDRAVSDRPHGAADDCAGRRRTRRNRAGHGRVAPRPDSHRSALGRHRAAADGGHCAEGA